MVSAHRNKQRHAAQLGSLGDWLSAESFLEFYPVLQSDGLDQESIAAHHDLIRHLHCNSYVALLNQLHTHPTVLSQGVLELVLGNPHEYILCIWSDGALIATAQISLLFPGMQPTVHISNVVVDSNHRGQGWGEFLLVYLRRVARKRWGQQYGSLRYELTSREERGTRGFYERLGFIGTPTVRYVR